MQTQLKFLPNLFNQCCSGREGKCTGCHRNKPLCSTKSSHFVCFVKNHVIHQTSLSKVGITRKTFKITVACRLPGLISWSEGNTSDSLQESRWLNKHAEVSWLHWDTCLNALQIWTFVTISSHLCPYKNSEMVSSRLLSVFIFKRFSFPLGSKGKESKQGHRARQFFLLVSLWDAPGENSSLTPVNSSRGSADFKWNIKSHWNKNNFFACLSSQHFIKFWAWTPARSFQK